MQPAPAWTTELEQAALHLVGLALDEDHARDDITSAAAIDPELMCDAVIVSRPPAIMAGGRMVELCAGAFDPDVHVTVRSADGMRIEAGGVIAALRGKARSLLTVERPMLNTLQRMCGVATLTRLFVDAVAGTGTQIVDTRKTVPGWRLLDKYAVRCGGGVNHRFSLADMFMFKDNHVAMSGRTLAQMVSQARSMRPGVPIACEATTLGQVDELLGLGVDILMLDNMAPATVRQAVALVQGRAVLEVTGGVTLKTVREYAATGVSRISIGALTHSAPAVDLTMDVSRAT